MKRTQPVMRKKTVIIRQVGNYFVETMGGFVMVKHWTVTNKSGDIKGIFFKFKAAKKACLDSDFNAAYQGRLY